MGGRSISDVAAEVGLGVHTIRYYEQAGLIPPVPRDAAGRRVFDEQSRDWLAYAVCLRALGMPVALVAEYVAITASGTHDAAHRAMMEEHLAELRKRRVELDHYIALVEQKLADLA